MGKARFNYVRRNERVVRDFTMRQKEIIGGYSKTPPSKRELTVIINKAKELGVPGIEESLFSLYEELFIQDQNVHSDHRTFEELRTALQEITPWSIQWKELRVPKYKQNAKETT